MPDRHAVLIGAGITGVLVARALALAGWQVTVLEASHVGAGSSSRTAAGIRQQWSTRETVIGMRYSVDFYRRFAEEVGQKTLVQNGYLFLSGDADQVEGARTRVQMQHECGLTEVELLEGTALTDRFPWVSGEAALAGTFCPSDGFLLPHIVYNEGARRCRELGVKILQNARVSLAFHENGAIREIKTTRGTVSGDLYIDCTNAWTWRTGKVLQASELPVAPLKRYLWFLMRDGDLSEDDLASMPLTICPSGVYCRPENRGTLLMGKKHQADPDYAFTYEDQDEVEPNFSHKTGIDAVPFELWMELAEVLPPVAEFGGINATTCGYYATTPDHNPFLDYDPAVRNLIRLVGFSGHGAMFGPFTARVAAALAEAGKSIDHIEIDGRRVALGAFAIGRAFAAHEALVI